MSGLPQSLAFSTHPERLRSADARGANASRSAFCGTFAFRSAGRQWTLSGKGKIWNASQPERLGMWVDVQRGQQVEKRELCAFELRAFSPRWHRLVSNRCKLSIAARGARRLGPVSVLGSMPRHRPRPPAKR